MRAGPSRKIAPNVSFLLSPCGMSLEAFHFHKEVSRVQCSSCIRVWEYRLEVSGVAYAYGLSPRPSGRLPRRQTLVDYFLTGLVSCTHASRTSYPVTRPSRTEIDGKPLPVRGKKIIRLVVRPKAKSESDYEKVAFLHKITSRRSRTQHRHEVRNPPNCMLKCHPRPTDYLRATAS